mmetsp:Transcript_18795/g.16641  ORF Transcript_18795/g.16641 Transcript_18795/m.16641 type:complete len:88 (+) Transcript_18795:117-380(+)
MFDNSQEFTEKLMKILLCDDMYMNYKLKITLKDISQIERFSDFITKVQFPKALEMEEVNIILSKEYPSPFTVNLPYEAIIKKEIDPS